MRSCFGDVRTSASSFEPGELDPYLPESPRIPDDAPLFTLPPGDEPPQK